MSRGLRSFGAVLTADLLDRCRTQRFWIALGCIAVLTWWCLPPVEAHYVVLGIGGHVRGRYSSAWVGLVLAVIASCWLSLIGFYLVRGSLTRDIDSQLWQLLVTTPMGRRSYLLAKWCSHLLVFALIVGGSLITGLAAQWIRAEDRRIHPLELLEPLLLLGMPALALTAMFAIWFDMMPLLRRTAGNITYFVAWLVMLASSVAALRAAEYGPPHATWIGDPNGLVTMAHAVIPTARAQLPVAIVGRTCLGCGLHQPPLLFEWTRWPIRWPDMPGRILWLVVALLGVVCAAPYLDRAAAHVTSSKSGASARPGARFWHWLPGVLAPLRRLGVLGNLVSAELLMTLRQRKLLWWLAMGVAFSLQLLAPLRIAALALMAAWLLSLDVFSRAALRERHSNTTAIVFCAPNAPWRILAARWWTLLILAWLPGVPALLRFLTVSPLASLGFLLVGLSISTWALALGALTRTSRTFEVLLCVLAYASVQGLPALDVAVAPLTVALWHLSLLALAVPVLLIAWPKLCGAH